MSTQETSSQLVPSADSKKDHPYQKVILAIFFMQHVLVGLSVPCFSSAPSIVEKVFGITDSQVILTPTMNIAGTFTVSLLNLFLVDLIGLKWANSLFSLFTVLGCSIRLLAFNGFFYGFLGQYVVGMGNSFILMSIMKLFKTWFSAERTRTIMPFLITGSPLGICIGVGLPYFFVNSAEPDLDKLKYQFGLYLWFHLCLSAFLALVSLVFFKEKPPTTNEEVVEQQVGGSLKEEVKNLFKSLVFWRFLGLVALSRAILLTTFPILAVIFKKLGGNEKLASPVLLGLLFSGYAGTLVFNKLLDRKFERFNFLIYIAFR